MQSLFFDWWVHSAASRLRNKIKPIDSLAEVQDTLYFDGKTIM